MPAPVVAPAVRPAKALAVSLAVVPRVAVKLSPPTERLSPACKATKVCVAVSVTAAIAGVTTTLGVVATAGGSAGLRMTGKSITLLPLTVDVKTTAFRLVPLVAAVLNPVN